MRVLYVDCETYSDLDLTRVGARVYAAHPSTEILCWSIYHSSWDRAAVFNISNLHTCIDDSLLTYFSQSQSPLEHTILIHWGQFDRIMAEGNDADRDSPFAQVPKIHDDMPQAFTYGNFSMLDLRQLCLQVGGPAKLKNAALWAGVEKLDGQRGIGLFSKPNSEGGREYPLQHPDKWDQFMRYAARDAEVLHAISKKIDSIPFPAINAEHYHTIGRMNERGIPIDVPSVKQTKSVLEGMEPGLIAECEQLTGGLRPTQTQKLAKWLEVENVQRETLENLREEWELPEDEDRVIELRLEMASATRHKLTPMLEQLGPDNRVRDQFTYYGAWTRRLTAQGTQPQNFYRGNPDEEFFNDRIWVTDPPLDFFSDVKRNIRGFIKAPPGRLLVAADFAQIELRVMAWLAGEEWLLDALERDHDVYVETASNIFRTHPDNITAEQRHVGKTVELASMYQIGGPGYYKREGRRAGLTEAQCVDAIQVYRSTHPEIVQLWGTMEAAFKKVVCEEGMAVLDNEKVTILRERDDLIRVIRPSTHYQCFWQPRLTASEYGLDVNYTGRNKVGTMTEANTYGGRLAQGVVQGIAADLMLCGMKTAEQMGYPPIMSVHDEIVCEIDDDGSPDHADNLERIFASQLPIWAKGLPVRAEGWQGKRFRK